MVNLAQKNVITPFGSTLTPDTKVKLSGQKPEVIYPEWTPYPTDLNQVKAVDYIVNGFVRNGIQLFAGATGVGKSTAMVPIATSVTGFGLQNSPLQTNRPRKVIYLTEDPEQVERILYAMKRSGNTRLNDPAFKEWFLLLESKRLPPEEFARRIDEYALDYGVTQQTESGIIVNSPLIVADTYSSNFSLDNENDNAQGAECIAKIKEPAMRHRMPIWIVAHTAKAMSRADFESLSARGAGSLEADVNGTGYLFIDEKLDKRVLRLKKYRFEPTIKEVAIETESYREVVFDEVGDSQEVWCRYGIPVKSSEEERYAKAEQVKQERVMKRISEIEEKILKVLLKHPKGISKSELCDQIDVKKSDCIGSINQLIDLGEIVEIDGFSKVGRKMKVLCHLGTSRANEGEF